MRDTDCTCSYYEPGLLIHIDDYCPKHGRYRGRRAGDETDSDAAEAVERTDDV